MDVDWSLTKKAKNLVEEQIPDPILKIPLVQDHRELMVDFLESIRGPFEYCRTKTTSEDRRLGYPPSGRLDG